MMAGDSDPPGWRPDRYLKEDPERAEAVLITLHKGVSPLIAAWGEEQAHDEAEVSARFMSYKTFLMDVFRAVRGERD